MYSGHGSGEQHFKNSLFYNSFFQRNQIKLNSEIESIKPDMFLFGCQSIANKMPVSSGRYGVQNSVLISLFSHEVSAVFGCSMNSVSQVLDPI